MKTTKMLYGVSVPKQAYADLKLVADVLAKQTTTNKGIREARKQGVQVALAAFNLMGKKFQ